MLRRSCWKSRHKNSPGPSSPSWIQPGLAALLWLCVTQLGCGSGAVGETKSVVQKDAEFDVTYNETVTSENQTIYAFNHTVSRNKVSVYSLPFIWHGMSSTTPMFSHIYCCKLCSCLMHISVAHLVVSPFFPLLKGFSWESFLSQCQRILSWCCVKTNKTALP